MIFRNNDYVTIGENGIKVYRISVCSSLRGEPLYYLAADADHPKAAKRVMDCYTWYPAHRLNLISTARVRAKAARLAAAK